MAIFLRKQKFKNGIYLSYVEGKYNPKKKNTSQRVIRKIGYLEELKKTYNDPITYFSEELTTINAENNKRIKEEKSERIPRKNTVKNVGYFLADNTYKLFAVDDEFAFLTLKRKFEFDVGSCFKFLTLSQIICPNSKIKEFETKDMFFDSYDFSDDQMYDAIKFIGENERYILDNITFQLKNTLN